MDSRHAARPLLHKIRHSLRRQKNQKLPTVPWPSQVALYRVSTPERLSPTNFTELWCPHLNPVPTQRLRLRLTPAGQGMANQVTRSSGIGVVWTSAVDTPDRSFYFL